MATPAQRTDPSHSAAAPSPLGVSSPVVGFDFTTQVRHVCIDITARLAELSHIDMSFVAIRCCQTRQPGPYGIQASLTPLRFIGGARETYRRGATWTIERICDPAGREMLYLLSFYLPRFQNLSFSEKLATICHELWHIGPAFDGDLRRHEGRCYAHGHSEKQFHAAMQQLGQRYQALAGNDARLSFLRHSFGELQDLHGRVYGIKIRTPRTRRQRA